MARSVRGRRAHGGSTGALPRVALQERRLLAILGTVLWVMAFEGGASLHVLEHLDAEGHAHVHANGSTHGESGDPLEHGENAPEHRDLAAAPSVTWMPVAQVRLPCLGARARVVGARTGDRPGPVENARAPPA